MQPQEVQLVDPATANEPGAHAVQLAAVPVVAAPEKPALHAQVKLPGVLVQVALAPQLLLPPGAHSLTSVQDVTTPAVVDAS